MSLNQTFKNILVIAAKNAVNAIVTNGTLMAMLPGVINLNSTAGLWNVLKVTISTVVAREGIVWLPKIIKWSATNAD